MKITKNKRGSPEFSLAVAFVAVIAMFASYSIITGKPFINKESGGKQFDIFMTYQEGEEVMFYLENAGKFVAEQVAYELAAKGGYIENNKCGVHKGYTLWNTETQDCYPEMDEIKTYYTKLFNQKLSNYTELPSIGNISNNYLLQFKQDNKLKIIVLPVRELDLIRINGYYETIVQSGKYTNHQVEPDIGPAKPVKPQQPVVVKTKLDLSLPLEMSVISSMASRPSPLDHSISSCFEDRRAEHKLDTRISRYHKGMDFSCAEGSNVLAFAEGRVISTSMNAGAYGVQMIVEHEFEGTGEKFYSVYGHLSRIKVNAGKKVKVGQVIALSGNTGDSTGPHLHFEIRLFVNSGANAFNPVCFDKRLFGSLRADLALGKGPCPDTRAGFPFCDWQNNVLLSKFQRVIS